ncbi:hypothetical protein FF38_08504 [Lucilia cuprina]|uniref:Uncharacterized protein n=1 Tax=Lucilia cuprina TaxID=7375 RepID=A0A0L0CCJ5_LUCCU|nr:hypothetical protein FF38_08504 [Lucilia cuprina]
MACIFTKAYLNDYHIHSAILMTSHFSITEHTKIYLLMKIFRGILILKHGFRQFFEAVVVASIGKYPAIGVAIVVDAAAGSFAFAFLVNSGCCSGGNSDDDDDSGLSVLPTDAVETFAVAVVFDSVALTFVTVVFFVTVANAENDDNDNDDGNIVVFVVVAGFGSAKLKTKST